jgi:hypothetical protein
MNMQRSHELTLIADRARAEARERLIRAVFKRTLRTRIVGGFNRFWIRVQRAF